MKIKKIKKGKFHSRLFDIFDVIYDGRIVDFSYAEEYLYSREEIDTILGSLQNIGIGHLMVTDKKVDYLFFDGISIDLRLGYKKKISYGATQYHSHYDLSPKRNKFIYFLKIHDKKDMKNFSQRIDFLGIKNEVYKVVNPRNEKIDQIISGE